MNIYRYQAFLEELLWLQDLFTTSLVDFYGPPNFPLNPFDLSITVRPVDADFLSLSFGAALKSLGLEIQRKGKTVVVQENLINSFWIVRDEEIIKTSSLPTHSHIKNITTFRDNKADPDSLKRPLFEMLTRYGTSPYFVWVFVKLDHDEKRIHSVDILILKPEKKKCFEDILTEIRVRISEEVVEEIGL